MKETEPLLQKPSIRLTEAQRIQRLWEGLILKETTTPANRLERWWQEALELKETADGKTEEEFNHLIETDPNFTREVGMEAIDNIIILLSLIDHLGLNVENLFLEKIGINFRKYAIGRMEELVASGMSRQEAMSVLKKEWNQMSNS